MEATAGTLILPDFLIDCPGERPKHGWGVRVLDDQIAAVAPNDQLRRDYPLEAIWDASGQTLAPGFVNAHQHLYGVLAHGIPLDKAPEGFWPFLTDFWWPLVEDGLDHELICAGTENGCSEMLRCGTTSFYDCTEGPFSLPGCLSAQAEVVRKYGLRGILSFEATERVSAKNGQLGLRENLDFIRSTKSAMPGRAGHAVPGRAGHAVPGRAGHAIRNARKSGARCARNSGARCPQSALVSGMMCYHTTFTCSAGFIRQAFEMAAEEGVAVHMHLSEGTYEPEHALRTFGVRPLAYYDQLGVAGPSMLASQCVQITADEIDILADRGARVVHMPLSNCEVGGGIAPVPELVDAGVTVGLGSDGYINDFFEVMRGAFLIHKAAHQDPRVMPAHLVWYLATEGGARALGLEKVGRLAPGWQADLQLIDSDLPTPLTEGNLYDQLLLYRNHTHVRGVMVAGQVRVRESELLGVDHEAVRARVHAAAQKLWARTVAW